MRTDIVDLQSFVTNIASHPQANAGMLADGILVNDLLEQVQALEVTEARLEETCDQVHSRGLLFQRMLPMTRRSALRTQREILETQRKRICELRPFDIFSMKMAELKVMASDFMIDTNAIEGNKSKKVTWIRAILLTYGFQDLKRTCEERGVQAGNPLEKRDFVDALMDDFESGSEGGGGGGGGWGPFPPQPFPEWGGGGGGAGGGNTLDGSTDPSPAAPSPFQRFGAPSAQRFPCRYDCGFSSNDWDAATAHEQVHVSNPCLHYDLFVV
jgi:hypothetical protein